MKECREFVKWTNKEYKTKYFNIALGDNAFCKYDYVKYILSAGLDGWNLYQRDNYSSILFKQWEGKSLFIYGLPCVDADDMPFAIPPGIMQGQWDRFLNAYKSFKSGGVFKYELV